MTNKDKQRGFQNEIPQRPVKYELGGDFYYTCHWMTCDEQLKRWWKYCPLCGQKIDWSDEE